MTSDDDAGLTIYRPTSVSACARARARAARRLPVLSAPPVRPSICGVRARAHVYCDQSYGHCREASAAGLGGSDAATARPVMQLAALVANRPGIAKLAEAQPPWKPPRLEYA